MATQPSKTLGLDGPTLRLGTNVTLGARTVGLTERVTARRKRDRLLVVHRHTGKRLANILRRQRRVRVRVRSLRVHIDQTHLNGRQRVLEVLASAPVTVITEPLVFRAPINFLFGMPNIGASQRGAVVRTTHVLDRHVSSENQQIGPAKAVTKLLFYGPQ